MADKWLNKDGTDPAAQYPPDWRSRALAAEKQAEIDADRANVYRDKWQAAEKQLATLAESGTGYSQQTVDAIVRERDALRAKVGRIRKHVEALRDGVEWACECTVCADKSYTGKPILAILNDKDATEAAALVAALEKVP